MHQYLPSRFVVAVTAAVVMLLSLAATGLAAPPSASGQSPRERVIVVFHENVGSPGAVASELSQRHNASVSHVYQHALQGFAAEIPAAAIPALANDARVAYVEVDQLAYTFEVPTGVDRIEADKRPSAGIDGNDVRVNIDVAIIDTGIDPNHPDLYVVGGVNCTGGGPFSKTCKAGGFADDNNHGTHVAGTVAALDNGFGVVGVAPGARLHGVKVLRHDGSGYMSWIIAGIDWVTANANTIEVANMSLGCECVSQAMDDAITTSTNAGIVYVVAAGNSGKNASTFSPANHPNVIAVSAMADFDGKAGAAAAPTCRSDVGGDDTFATFSNFGNLVDIAAPGVCIESTIPGGGYAQYSGTSMASPHVAGEAALYIVESGVGKNTTTSSTVRSGLQSSDWSVANNDSTCGFSGAKSSERFLRLAACETASGTVPETGTLSGTVKNNSTGVAITGATVTVEGTTSSATTNSSGSYTFTGVPAGDYTVTASAEGYQSENSVVKVNAGSTTTVNFSLTVSSTDAGGTLSVDVTTDQSSYTLGNTVAIRVTVTDGANPVADAAVAVTITTASKRIYTGSATTDGSGQAVVRFKPKKPDGSGTCTVDVTASKSGYVSGSGGTAFTVNEPSVKRSSHTFNAVTALTVHEGSLLAALVS